MLGLNNFNLDGNDKLNLVSDVRNTYLRSDRGHFFKKKGPVQQSIRLVRVKESIFASKVSKIRASKGYLSDT